MSQFDKFKQSIAQVIAALLPPADYLYALQPSKVIKQNANGTVCLRPDNPNLKDLDNVPIRTGVPGIEVEIEPGSYMLLGFEGGSPACPVAYLWQRGVVGKIKVSANEITFNGGTAKVAREGDPVNLGTLSGSNTGGPVLFVYTPPGGLPSAPLAVIPLNGGKITDGAAGVKA